MFFNVIFSVTARVVIFGDMYLIFSDIHEAFHQMGYIIFGAAGNSGNPTPHHPWGQCPKCIVVGAENHATRKIAEFSSGCCSQIVDVAVRGTNFALSMNTDLQTFSGTSFATAILSGSFTFFLPLIWRLDKWKTIHDTVKDFLRSTCDKQFGYDSKAPHTSMEWNRFNFRNAVIHLVNIGKLHRQDTLSLLSRQLKKTVQHKNGARILSDISVNKKVIIERLTFWRRQTHKCIYVHIC